MSLNTRWIVLIGVTAFAVVLAVILGTRLSGQVAWFAFALAVGVVSGVASGIAASTLITGNRPSPTSRRDPEQPSATILLTPDQADVLVKLLGRSQSQPGSFPLRTSGGRRFSTVGGADFTDEPDKVAEADKSGSETDET